MIWPFSAIKAALDRRRDADGWGPMPPRVEKNSRDEGVHHAEVVVQNSAIMGKSLFTVHRAVCWDHPHDVRNADLGIAPWMGPTYPIEAGNASHYWALTDARAHDRVEHS